MKMRHKQTTLIGKAIKSIAKLRGGGSALPGLVVEKIDKDFVKRCLESLPYGVVVVSGTNGKTTTTKMVVELLEATGLRVFTNRTGSNFSRGVAAALLGEVDNNGKLNADIAVLELDEAHAVHFVRTIPPRYSLLLNVMRDQLDRFGEVEKAAKLLEAIAVSTTDTVVVNLHDPYLYAIAKNLPDKVQSRFFGLSPQLESVFPNEKVSKIDRVNDTPDVVLKNHKEGITTFDMDRRNYTTSTKLGGIYNLFNAAAAIATVRVIKPEASNELLVKTVASITPAFGRGETLSIDGETLELVLVKNPGGFQLGLKSFNPKGYETMIAVNDSYADGRDVSWLWDVEFSTLLESGVNQISGTRAYDMALRLQYDDIPIGDVNTDLKSGLIKFLKNSKGSPKRIYCTYTAMTSLRRQLAKLTDVEAID